MTQITAGRASEIFDLGGGRVLRRFKGGGDPEREASVMRHVTRHGYPVPGVLEVLPDALVLERIEGPTMSQRVQRRPWLLRRQARVLAGLHERLHAITAPRLLGHGSLLHLDLHPANVILSPAGPVVLDWTNASAGEPALDVALTWIIVATAGGPRADPFLRAFLAQFDQRQIRGALAEAGDLRCSDPNVTDDEREAVRELVRSAGGV